VNKIAFFTADSLGEFAVAGHPVIEEEFEFVKAEWESRWVTGRC
jgi:hypothetical protein